MAEESSAQEKTEQPTPKRLDDAKKKGQVPRSKELNTMMLMAVAAVSFILLGQTMMTDLTEMMKNNFQPSRADIFDGRAVLRFFYAAIIDGVSLLGPFFGLMIVAALLAPLSIGGWSFSMQAIQPKMSKLNPIKGLKKVFSAKGLMEMIKALAKFFLVAAVAITIIWVNRNQYLLLGTQSLDTALSHAADLLTTAFLLTIIALIVIAAIDVPFQIFDHNKQMRMTKQEVKDEMKDTEGKPEVKGKIRQLQREMAEARMMEAIPDADVVVTNPTHFAVALKYDSNMRAPRVVARGADLVAANIRRVAEENEVLLVESPPLARALYHSTDIGEEIPHGLYVAVAQILAYVYQLKNVQKNGGKKPTQPETELPDEYQTYVDMGQDNTPDDEPTVH
jgi:flagellar biosynthesis protein FlhB